MATATAAPIICRDVLRIKALRPYEDPNTTPGWRLGPTTPDGFWMVTRNRKTTTGDERDWAVRVVIDPEAKSVGVDYKDLDDALYGRLARRDEVDAYLASIEIVRMIPPDELTRLREAVLAGKTGGPSDGEPRKRTRKVATS
jgi:hypothetical protein